MNEMFDNKWRELDYSMMWLFKKLCHSNLSTSGRTIAKYLAMSSRRVIYEDNCVTYL